VAICIATNIKQQTTLKAIYTQSLVTLYNIKNQQDATLTVLFISHCKIALHVSDAFCVHHQEY